MENVGVLQGGIEAVQSVCAKVKNLRKIKGGFTMFQVLKKRIKNEKGLSLVELLAVIVILGIISAIAIPAIGNIIKNSEAKAEIADAIQVMNAANIYFADNPTATTFTLEDAGDYVEGGKLTAFTVTKATPNTITFTGTKLGEQNTARTLAQLSALKVKNGKITGDGTNPGDEDEGEGGDGN